MLFWGVKPFFPRIKKAIEFTLEYHTKGRVIEYLQAYTRMARGSSSGSYLVDNWEELLYRLHNYMEDEILQTIYTSNQNTQVIMFEELREWIDIDWRLKEKPDSNFFWNVVDEHNEKLNAELEERLQIEVSKFQDTDHYKNFGENQEYEAEVFGKPLWGLVANQSHPISFKEKRINRKYYCNELSTDFLDYYQLDKYNEFVSRIVGNFRGIVQKHLSLFDAGKYVPLQEISTYKENLRLHPPNQKLIETPLSPDKKLVVDLSVPELVALFCMLREMNIIKEPVNTELARFIKANFSTKGSPDISEKTLVNQFSSLDISAIDHWLEQLKQMRIALANLKV